MSSTSRTREIVKYQWTAIKRKWQLIFKSVIPTNWLDTFQTIWISWLQVSFCKTLYYPDLSACYCSDLVRRKSCIFPKLKITVEREISDKGLRWGSWQERFCWLIWKVEETLKIRIWVSRGSSLKETKVLQHWVGYLFFNNIK